MYLVIDTETTGLPLWKEHIGHPDQPDLVQIAALLFNPEGNLVSSYASLIYPLSAIHPKALETHGIALDYAREYGTSCTVAAEVLKDFLDHATVIIAHNVKFDAFLLNRLFWRTSTVFPWQADRALYCTMEESTAICQLPATAKMKSYNMGKYKSPRLAEAYTHLFGVAPPNKAHDALADATACAEIFFELRRRKDELEKKFAEDLV